jgi:hypothetical protein
MVSLPDGVWLAYEDVVVTTYTTSMASKWITLTVPYTLAKNTFYAIVANAQSGTFNSSTQIFFCGYNTASYAGGAAFFPTTGRMAASNNVASGDYVLGYRTSSQSYYGVTMPLGDDAIANVEMGARFTVPSGQYSSIECLGIRNKINAAGQQTVRLYDSSNNVIAIAMPKFDITVGRAIYDTYWDTAVTLIAGQTYYWGSVCPTSTQWASQMSVDDVIDWTADTAWQFVKARRTTPITGTWAITTTENYEHQLILGNVTPFGGVVTQATITVAPGDTSRSVYVYQGSTGLTHTTANLTASYTRNGQASVPITLVAQTPTGSYVSGGFCEVSAPYARGTYRLDVPNAAFDFGADDVTIFVGGTNTTNGAVVTCNMQGIAGNIVHIGPFKVIGDGLGSDQPLDIVQGVQAPVSVQLVDANENGVDISGATVEAKVYNAIGSLIATYSCVPVYAADGRCTFQLTTLVTNAAGVYNITLTRMIGGNIVVFGPMKMIVRAN